MDLANFTSFGQKELQDIKIEFMNPKFKIVARMNQHPPAWMGGALIRFSFLSMCHPRLTFFLLPFFSLHLSFFLQLYFLLAPFLVFFSQSQFFFETLFFPAAHNFYFFAFENFPSHPAITSQCPPLT